MATIIVCSNSFFSFLLYCLVIGLAVRFLEEGSYGVEGRLQATKSHQQLHRPYAHLLHPSSLLPSSACKHSSKGLKNGASLKVVHRHGPCAQFSQNPPSLAKTLAQDQSRVDSIHLKLASRGDNFSSSDATLPATSGRPLGTGNYVVTVGLGTPKSDLPLAFDTGSDLTWTQCEPCSSPNSCYTQKDPKFNPAASTSYSNATCDSAACKQLASATSAPPGCSVSTCLYSISYGDQSFSKGWFATETLTLSSEVFPGFKFGCGQENNGLFGQTAGLLGLGLNAISLVSQTAKKYGRVFSYCLPSSPSSTGHLTFGPHGGGSNSSVKFTPLTARSSTYYFLELVGINVGGQKLNVVPSVFSSSRTIIDSGTVITRLPATAYAALRSAFRQQMSNYTLTNPFALFDTCYDFSKYDTVSIPTVSLLFGGGTQVQVDALGTMTGPSQAQLCLAFAGNRNDNELSIIGNLQQITYDVVYDVGGRKVGFGSGGCE